MTIWRIGQITTDAGLLRHSGHGWSTALQVAWQDSDSKVRDAYGESYATVFTCVYGQITLNDSCPILRLNHKSVEPFDPANYRSCLVWLVDGTRKDYELTNVSYSLAHYVQKHAPKESTLLERLAAYWCAWCLLPTSEALYVHTTPAKRNQLANCAAKSAWYVSKKISSMFENVQCDVSQDMLTLVNNPIYNVYANFLNVSLKAVHNWMVASRDAVKYMSGQERHDCPGSLVWCNMVHSIASKIGLTVEDTSTIPLESLYVALCLNSDLFQD